MKLLQTCLISSALAVAATLAGCSTTTKTPDVADAIRKSLDVPNLKGVTVSQDRDKGVVTLTGHVASDNDKAQAESIAKSMAAGQVVADEIRVLPPGAEREARTVDADLDKAIEKNLDAALIQQGLNKGVSYDVKNGVVTLKGEVQSQLARSQVQAVTVGVPNVQQVVNELQVKNQRATSSN
jgi:hyperosmotically inducible protein